MKNIKYILLTIIIVTFTISGNLLAQKKPIIAGAEVSYLSPFGTLANRWTGVPGFSVYLGTQTSENWAWFGKAEYFKFDKMNKNHLKVHSDVTIGTTNLSFDLPLTKLSQSLTVAGVSANAKYNVLRTSSFEANIDFGFGIYNWNYKRSAYDSLTVDTTIAGASNHILIFGTVPENSQKDWSAGFNIGFEMSYKIIEPVELTIAANYKNIVGELWPALTFDMENVATMQMFDIRGGIRIRL